MNQSDYEQAINLSNQIDVASRTLRLIQGDARLIQMDLLDYTQEFKEDLELLLQQHIGKAEEAFELL